MKRSVAFLFFSTVCFLAFSQTSKGRFWVSGKTGVELAFGKMEFYYDGTRVGEAEQGSRITTLKTMPSIGYFIFDNLSVHLSGELAATKWEKDDISTSFVILPSVQYFIPVRLKLKPFVGVGAGYGLMPTPSTGWTQAGGFAWRIDTGAAYFIKDNLSIDISGQFLRFTPRAGVSSKLSVENNTFDLFIGFSVFL